MPVSSSAGSGASMICTAVGLDRSAVTDAVASRPNLEWTKEQGISDVAFAKKRGLKVPEMVRSSWVYRQLRRFRAGIPSRCSSGGVGRCTWKGWAHFQQYVYLSITSFNLLVLARLLL